MFRCKIDLQVTTLLVVTSRQTRLLVGDKLLQALNIKKYGLSGHSKEYLEE
jgi:hypothetical protein